MSTVDLMDEIESLEYWRGRRKRLSWYRFAARREAKLMTRRWELRVREAVLSQRGVSFAARVGAGVLLARIGLQRFRFRAKLVAMVLAATVFAMLLVPLLLTLLLLTQIF
jgi:hypothetical protein